MQIVIDTAHDSPEQIRRAARFLYVLAGPAADAPVDPKGTERVIPETNLPRAPVTTFETAPSVPEPSRAYIPPPPPPEAFHGTINTAPGNVVNFPPPPRAPNFEFTGSVETTGPVYAGQIHADIAARTEAEAIALRMAPTLPHVGRVDYTVDSAGMPWDARIHQEKKTKKKDGTWKIKKGLDQKILQAVVAELAAARGPASTVPPAPATVPLPPGVPAPPTPVSAVTTVSLPGSITVLPTRVHTGAVPAPPTLSASDVSAYRMLMDKISDATITGKLEPGVVHNIIQRHGVPNLQALYGMPHLIPDVNTSINLALSGFHT